jgi:MFS transporter, SET family, sugar efflux transporter
VKRLLVPSAALLWGLQFAFLNPALALLLVALFDATPAEVGWVLVVYNASGFVASLVLPAYADRTADYLRPILACAPLTLALAALLAVTTSLPIVVLGLLVLGGPAGVGSSLTSSRAPGWPRPCSRTRGASARSSPGRSSGSAPRRHSGTAA